MVNNNVYIDVFMHIENQVVKLPLEEVVTMATLAQVKTDFHFDLIKAQSIIARTHLVRLARNFDGSGCSNHKECDICDEGHCIQFANIESLKELWADEYEKNLEKIKKAVKETEGLILLFDNKPIEARFHDTCGGSTENSENTMSRNVVYLRRVLCEYCTNSPNWEIQKSLSIEDIEKKLSIKFPLLKPTLKTSIEGFFDDIKRDEYGRVISMKVSGKEFKGSEIIDILGIDSTKFSFSPSSITFVVRGKGDGLGLCQYGGNQMALDGKNYLEILKYYFTGIEIKKIEKPCIKKPLKGRIIMLDPGHGGENSQDYVGMNGTREKDVVLKIAQKLKLSIESLGGIVFLTRNEDEYISLLGRAQVANKIRPNFFISIHLNGYSNPSIHGCEIYYYRNDKESEKLARSIMNNLITIDDVVDHGIKVAEFYLLREVAMSSIQLEVDYITNPEQEVKLNNDIYIDKIVEKITGGLVDYYKH